MEWNLVNVIKAPETNQQKLVSFVANFLGKDKNAGKALFSFKIGDDKRFIAIE